MADIRLLYTENDRPITREEDGVFYAELQRTLLLALQEAGDLTETQYQRAERRISSYQEHRRTSQNKKSRSQC